VCLLADPSGLATRALLHIELLTVLPPLELGELVLGRFHDSGIDIVPSFLNLQPVPCTTGLIVGLKYKFEQITSQVVRHSESKYNILQSHPLFKTKISQ
jgi:hypothetical protein